MNNNARGPERKTVPGCGARLAYSRIYASQRLKTLVHDLLLLLDPQDTEILLGDIQQPESLQAIARRTKVMIALAGPYAVWSFANLRTEISLLLYS